MSTIIMLFILPLGIAVYFWDRRNYAQNLGVFRDYISQITHADLPDTEKMERIDEMFYQNGYTRIERTATRLIIEKKHFNIGVLFISLGALTYFGLFIYLIYYRFFQKPRRLSVDLREEIMMREIGK
ncbi:MAG: hypothetical protein PHQ90_10195 [Sulfuricurvum sp.]|uniref:hypothetical protein n=1 Tax=Sulfuricurvum sp. TaxID=2025608 RepID=UPI00262A3AB4|nr:hypothetical protein [Sulfuricurvum sp.]MDD2369662.1 hypothetical protein [Sulfuricurvum sp.]MDD2950472.1 hypothetical protein [Sulfuricurvum sp.]MDD5119291.1 hypothetical protein [Sulfuricurvum sp.]